MRTTHKITSTTGVTRRAPVVSTLAAVLMALPLSGLLGGAALADEAADTSATPAAALKVAAAGDRGNSEAAQAAADAAAAERAADKAAAEAAEAASDKKAAELPAAVKTAENKPADFIGPVVPAKKADAAVATSSAKATGANSNSSSTPFTNPGGVTTGSNTTTYEVVNGRDGSPAVGGGKPSGDVQQVQPYSKADQNNTGANDTSASNPYRSTRDGAPSLNGNGGGLQVGQPCAGCVGKADNKNPKGQAPNATDGNAGYECDRNHGIGRSNPAHTGCTTTTTTPQYDCEGHLLPNSHAHNCNPVKQYDCKGHELPNNHAHDCNPGSKDVNVTLCHATGSSSNPYVTITVDHNGALNGHEKHADDDIPAYSYTDKAGNTVNVPARPGKGCQPPQKQYDCAGHELPNNHTAAECTQNKLYDCKGHELPNNHGTAECETGKAYDCKGHELPNNHGTAECETGKTYDCKGHELPNNHSASECEPPVVTVCPAGTMQTPAGCVTTGNTDGETSGPGKIVPNAPVITPIDGTDGAPAEGPTGLPFTGTDALLLAQLSALMLLVGAGLVGMGRKKKAIAAL